MMFTQEQINEIKQRLSLSGIKDSELDKLNLLEHPLTGKEVIIIVKDGENLRISVEDLYEEFAKYIEQSENKEDFFNVSVYLGRLDPEFENAAKPCTLEEAINACPPYIRRAGQMISFLDSHNMKWKTYQYIGTESDDWSTNIDDWQEIGSTEEKGGDIIDMSILAAVGGVPHKYNGLAGALTAANILLSEDQKKGGMSIKFIKTTAATYSVIKGSQATGTQIPYSLTLESGTYTARDIEGVDLPVNVDESVSYYYQDGSNVISWTITKITDNTDEYKQYRLRATSWSTNVDYWQDTDSPKLRHLTQAEYDALTEEEKMNGTYYFIEE